MTDENLIKGPHLTATDIKARRVTEDLRYQTQKYKHDPENGIFGDCARTVIACLLQMPRDEVPHYYKKNSDNNDAIISMDKWLAGQGFARVNTIFYGDHKPEDVMRSVSNINPNLRFSLIGKSKNGVSHVVICKNGEIDHDPAIDKSGIVGPCDDGYYWVEFLTSIWMVSLEDGQHSKQLEAKKAPTEAL